MAPAKKATTTTTASKKPDHPTVGFFYLLSSKLF